MQMRYRSNIAKTLLQVATIVFLMNSVAAYGACCFAASAGDGDDTAAVVMPCHQTDENEPSGEGGECCLMCISLSLTTSEAPHTGLQPFSVFVKAPPAMVKSNIDPPFRPPIDFLS